MFCRHCGSSLPDNSDFCFRCGKVQSDKAENKRKNTVGLLLGAFAFLCFAIIIFVITSGGLDDSSISPTGNNNPSIGVHGYSAGTYKIGTDIPAGEYFILPNPSRSCYWQVSSDSTNSISSIVANDSIDTFAFVSVSEGQYLTVNNGHFVDAEDAAVPDPNKDGIYSPGMYRVGVDIPAGEYKVSAMSNRWCYMEVSRDSSGTLYSIVTNDNIEASTYITVVDGQYLTITNGTFRLVE